MRCSLIAVLFLFPFSGFSQNVNLKIAASYQRFLNNEEVRHATISLYVVNSNTGNIIFKKNEETGLPSGSVQKVITSVTAYELLGADFRYNTSFSYTGIVRDSILLGTIHVKGCGDPTLGSNRYQYTSEYFIVKALKSNLSFKGIRQINGGIETDNSIWPVEGIPDHWIWQDLGNYYGARTDPINWKENQYDVILRSGKNTGDSVLIAGTKPSHLAGLHLRSVVTSAVAGSGDNTNIYLPVNDSFTFIRGTIPVNQLDFSVSGSLPDPAAQLQSDLQQDLNITNSLGQSSSGGQPVLIYNHLSPKLDSINYWFLQKSINLYGEALLKTIAYQLNNHGSTESGISVVKDFWSRRGIDNSSIKIFDGSGLSPENRITTRAVVTVMQYARKQKWFNSFYNSLPEINKTKMKSGTIGGTLAYTGYVTNAVGVTYTFAFVVHNYEGSAKMMREKMWKIIDILK
ncbi:D-alanyl-D-alanine carboxypeptidase/D-alanyl-D-alanine-endopeptidase [soil metagenome]